MIHAESTFRGTTAAELAARTRWDSFRAAVHQRAIFRASAPVGWT